MKMILKSLILKDFKGVKEKRYDFESRTKVFGMNRTGKTTIATAWFWLMADKDYELHSNPNIRPADVEECIPAVTAILDIDGKEITVTKMQKRTVSKPNDKGISKVTLTNTYEVNSVPKTERDFKSYLEDMGLSFEKFLVCSHPDMFTSQKTADMRKVLFSMASEKSDYDIASMWTETADVAKLLVDYTYEEIEAMNKASKKKAAEQVDAIPNQIIGLERAKVDLDVAEQELAKADLERRIADLDKMISGSNTVTDTLIDESRRIQLDIMDISKRENDALFNERRNLENKKYGSCKVVEGIRREYEANNYRITSMKAEIELADKKRKELGDSYKNLQSKVFDEAPYLFNESEWVFDEDSTVCSMCGQALPEDKITQLRSDFEQRRADAMGKAEKAMVEARSDFETYKRNALESIKAEGFKQKDLITKLADDIQKLEHKNQTLKQEEAESMCLQDEITRKLDALPAEVDLSGNEEYLKLKVRYESIQSQIAELRDKSGNSHVLSAQKQELVVELDTVKEKIAQHTNNVRIDEQISKLQEKQRDYEQTKADAEKILYQLSLVSKKKNELLVEEINNHFGIVKWLLFDYQKNGEYKEVCIPMIDGKRFGESTNTGREIQAKLDICNSFQKFFGMNMPVFLDGAESLNDCYMPEMDCQLITLNVSEDSQLKVEVA